MSTAILKRPETEQDYLAGGGSGEYYSANLLTTVGTIRNETVKAFAEPLLPFVNKIVSLKKREDNYLNYMLLFAGNFNEISPSYARAVSNRMLHAGFIHNEIDSASTYLELFKLYQSALQSFEYKPSFDQRVAFHQALMYLSRSTLFSIKSIDITVSADEELVIVRQDDKGLHYLIVGREKDEVFYGFSGKKLGDYFSVSIKDMSFSSIINYFIGI